MEQQRQSELMHEQDEQLDGVFRTVGNLKHNNPPRHDRAPLPQAQHQTQWDWAGYQRQNWNR
jgi:hypothetical protein